MILCPVQNTADFTTAWIQKRPRVTQVYGMTDFAKTGVYGYDSNGRVRGHNGIDFGIPTGTAIFAPMSGEVKSKNSPNGYGLHLKIRNPYRKLEMVLAHLSYIDIPTTSTNTGDFLALSGNTGLSTGAHLHFGVRRLIESENDVWSWLVKDYDDNMYGYIDPAPFLITWKGTILEDTLF